MLDYVYCAAAVSCGVLSEDTKCYCSGKTVKKEKL